MFILLLDKKNWLSLALHILASWSLNLSLNKITSSLGMSWKHGDHVMFVQRCACVSWWWGVPRVKVKTPKLWFMPGSAIIVFFFYWILEIWFYSILQEASGRNFTILSELIFVAARRPRPGSLYSALSCLLRRSSGQGWHPAIWAVGHLINFFQI